MSYPKLVQYEPEQTRKHESSWLYQTSRHGLERLLDAVGIDIVLRLRDSSVYVGTYVRSTARGVTLALWGCGGRRRAFARADIEGVSVVPPHSFADEREARKRQRRGEPAIRSTRYQRRGEKKAHT